MAHWGGWKPQRLHLLETHKHRPVPTPHLTSTTLWNTNLRWSRPYHQLENVLSKAERKEKEHTHVKNVVIPSGPSSYQWRYMVKKTLTREKQTDKYNNTVISYVTGLSEKLWRIFFKNNIPVHFKSSHTLREKLVHPNDKTPKHKLSNIMYAVQSSKECFDLYIGETKHPLRKMHGTT